MPIDNKRDTGVRRENEIVYAFSEPQEILEATPGELTEQAVQWLSLVALVDAYIAAHAAHGGNLGDLAVLQQLTASLNTADSDAALELRNRMQAQLDAVTQAQALVLP